MNKEKTHVQIRPNVCFEGNTDDLKERAYAYFIRGYVKPIENELLTLLLQSAKHWAYVWHDKDDKAPHCHIIVIFQYNKTPTAMAKELCRIDNTQNWHFSILHDRYHAFDYLYHRDVKSIELGKYPYTDSDVMTEDISFFTRGGQSARDNLAFYNDLVENNFSHVEMARKYGRDYLKNIAKYDKAKAILQREISQGNEDTSFEGLNALTPSYWGEPLATDMLLTFVNKLKTLGIKFEGYTSIDIDRIIRDTCTLYFE